MINDLEETFAEGADTKSVRAVERAADILFCFGPTESELDVAALRRMTGLSRPTIYRLLHTLELKGLIHSFGEPRKFQLGYRIVPLAQAWNGGFPILQVAKPMLDELWQATEETVALSVALSPRERFCALEIRGPQPISFSRGIGYTEVLHRGACGKVILAHLPDDQIENGLKAVPAGKVREKLRTELMAIRKSGYAITYGEIITGVVAVSAPILNSDGNAEGSVGVFGTETRLRGETLKQTVAFTRNTAKKASEALGFLPHKS